MSYCKWSDSCPNPGPWLAYIEGQWFECTQPAKADKPLYCTAHAREFVKTVHIPQSVSDEGEISRNPKASPLLTFCRRMIETATEDAQETFLTGPCTGEPTATAFHARSWFELRPDWHNKDEFYGSFEWCCHWLSFNTEQTRSARITTIDNALAQKFIALRREYFTKAEPYREVLETNRSLQRLLTQRRQRFEAEEQALIRMAMGSVPTGVERMLSRPSTSQLLFAW